MENTQAGKLYIVATPIGNYHDMSPRGVQVLSEADIIAAEDTRRTIILLNKLGLRKEQLVSNHNYNEGRRIKYFIEQLSSGKSVAVVTDAGTPCISDPGNELIKAAIKEGIQVVGIPGCCAAVNALVVSGFDLRSFLFCGFFPRENGERLKHVRRMRREAATRTFVYYESPKRIMGAMDFFIDNGVDCQVSLSNDMTKRYEMTFRGTPSEVKAQLEEKGSYDENGEFAIKGEFVIVLELNKEYMITQKEHVFTPEAMIVEALVKSGCSVKEAVEIILADETNTYSKNELKAAGIRLKNLL